MGYERLSFPDGPIVVEVSAVSSQLKSSSYVLAIVERGQVAQVVNSVKQLKEIEEGALLVGRFDLIVRVTHYDRSDLYKSVTQIRNMPGIRGTSTHIPFEGFTKEYVVDENDALAISLLRSDGSPSHVLTQLKNLQHVVGAHIIPGDWDLLAILHSKRVEQILDTAVTQFEGVKGITKTETLLANQYFRREVDSTISVGTYVPEFAFEKLKDKTVLGLSQ